MFQKPTPLTWMTFGVVFAWYGHSCQTNIEPESTQQSFELSDEVDLDRTAAQRLSEQNQQKNEKKLALAHPKQADAWHTRKLIMTFPQPSPERILQCKETAESIALPTKNFRDLNDAALTIGTKVSQNTPLFHWCFYQLMIDLDIKMDRDGSLLSEKSDVFLSRMRVLYVIARTLDDASSDHTTRYSAYLRTRYMEISQHQFGRPTEIMDPEGLLQTAGKSGKTAEPYEDP